MGLLQNCTLMGSGNTIEDDIDGVFARNGHLLACAQILDGERTRRNLVFSEEDHIRNSKLVGVLDFCLNFLASV